MLRQQEDVKLGWQVTIPGRSLSGTAYKIDMHKTHSSLVTVAGEAKRPKRLTREQSKAQTRARLIEVGRQHILRDGLGDAVAERIAEDAGFSRGAFYANFADKENLFLTIIRKVQEEQFALFRSLLEHRGNSEVLFRSFREAFADHLMNRDWIILWAEFEAAALRNAEVRQVYVELHRRILSEGREIVREMAKSPQIHFTMKPNEFLLAMLSFAHGMAVTQRLLGAEMPQKSTRRLVCSLFDHLVSLR